MFAPIVSLTVAFLLVLVHGKQFSGTFQLIFKRLYLCDDVGDGTITFSTKLSKLNRTHMSYSSDVAFPEGFRDDQTITIDLSVFGNGGWKKNFINLKFNRACSDITRMFPGLVPSFLEAAGYNFTSCPVPPNTYKVQNWFFHIPVATTIMPYGKYKVDISVYDKERMQNCFILEVDCVPLVMKTRRT